MRAHASKAAARVLLIFTGLPPEADQPVVELLDSTGLGNSREAEEGSKLRSVLNNAMLNEP